MRRKLIDQNQFYVFLLFAVSICFFASCERKAPDDSKPIISDAPINEEPQPPPRVECPGIETERELTEKFLKENRSRFEKSFSRSLGWFQQLSVDPFELRDQGIKGKKKLSELIDAYSRIYSGLSERDKELLKERIEQVVAITYEPRYHNMAEVEDTHFKQDATSYMRVAYLMDGLGLDTGMYREEILKIKPRLDGHMKIRGAHQQMAFHWYYGHFGLEEPFPLEKGYQRGFIHARRDPYRLSRSAVYHLTHEIFVPYGYGDNLDAEFFDEEELEYLRWALDRLTVHYIMRNDPDLTAELLLCVRYLKMTGLPVYREGLAYLFDSQNVDGSWGDYDRLREKYNDYVDQGFYLHTTGVALDALIIAFVFPEGDFLPVTGVLQKESAE